MCVEENPIKKKVAQRLQDPKRNVKMEPIELKPSHSKMQNIETAAQRLTL
jgi:hypothetical protein